MLLSGRRPIELCLTGDFCADEALPLHHVWFTGQAKTRDEERAQQPMRIPLLCDTTLFLDAFERFLHLPSLPEFLQGDVDENNPDIRRKFKQCGITYGGAYRTHFARLMPAGTTAYSLRDAYGLIAFYTARPPGSPNNPSLYLREILGHDDERGETSLSYQTLTLAEFSPPQWEL
jgi:hypothetical protein